MIEVSRSFDYDKSYAIVNNNYLLYPDEDDTEGYNKSISDTLVGFNIVEFDRFSSHIHRGVVIREVTVPECAMIINNGENGWTVNRIIIKKRFILSGDSIRIFNERCISINYEPILAYFCRIGDIKGVKYLVEDLKTDINSSNGTPVINAISNGHIDVVEYLISMGVNIHVGDEISLMIAITSNRPDIVKLLIDNHANIHINDDYPLYKAIIADREKICSILIEYGGIEATPKMRTIAKENGYYHLAEYLKICINKKESAILDQSQVEIKHHKIFRDNFNKILKEPILGPSYYNMEMNFYSCDIATLEDIKNKYDFLKSYSKKISIFAILLFIAIIVLSFIYIIPW